MFASARKLTPTQTVDFAVEVTRAHQAASHLSTTLASLFSGLNRANLTLSFWEQTHHFAIAESSGNGFMPFSDKNLRDFGWNEVGTNRGARRSLNAILASPDADVG